MASPLESLRLFDLDSDPGPSEIETKDEFSHFKTKSSMSRIETQPEESASENLLRVVSDAAKKVAEANRHLVAAVEAARAGACKWRDIGIAAGIPHQTLHRRYRQGSPR